MAHADSAESKIRAQLKEWERAFSAANNGKKAGKEDIKKDPGIGMYSIAWKPKVLS